MAREKENANKGTHIYPTQNELANKNFEST